ncbi:MerR family transcriptional regulator [Enterococcus quebecensis]|nr:MerR family transcriptional regulator [Enterococcus quebecensis]
MTKGDFTIKEIAKMYGISTHTLRHYEKLMMIQPERTDNNYRSFSEKDIYNLNIIRDLKELGVPLKTIQSYLENRTVENTTHLLRENSKKLEAEISLLKKKVTGITSRLKIMEELKTRENQMNQLIIRKIEERRAFQRLSEFTDEAGFEKEMRSLYGELLDVAEFYQFHYVGGIIDWLPPESSIYKGVFILESKLVSNQLNQFILEEGSYASYFYKGNYEQTSKYIAKMEAELKREHYRIIPPFYEFYLIDFHETNDKKEYLTEIQVKVEKS